ncbi:MULTISPECIES: SAM-dependent methyltransferase [Thermomonosporaceae]|uniref:SAM-dependent methyltransferase n=1 Tax=Thermomonosporaceae TaxID=2012 RepID=UPI00255B1379|nr:MULTISPECIES: SAM-dependent methyltransferase [Thermomonosporaceae]MDL4775381.1 SAM-dependent methyltransferase [Actinomadura xylanilytica]
MRPNAQQPPPLDSSRPSPARMYDFFLGGKDNYEVDRQAGAQVKAALGEVMSHDIVWENRRFLQRAVHFMAEAGIDQFVDLGTGLPTQGNVHEIAQEVHPDARVVYVDNDPIVLAHGRALLATNDTTTVITADVREPGTILEHPDLRNLIDFSRPVAVLSVALFHFIGDAADPAGIVRAFRDRMHPGSHLALSHLTVDGPPADEVAQVVDAYKDATSPIVFRPRDRIEPLFDGFDLVDPGLVRPWQWRPGYGPAGPRTEWLYAGVGRLTSGGVPG